MISTRTICRKVFAILFLLNLMLICACKTQVEQQNANDKVFSDPDDFRFIALGQALIEHDLRTHSDFAVKQAAEYLKGADVCFSDLEAAIQSKFAGEKTRESIYFHAAEPEVLDCLKEMGINMLALSNNHAWDLGTQGLLGTIKEVEEHGFIHAGTGETIMEASMPGYLDTSKGRVALIAMASGKYKDEAIATANHAGVNILRFDPDDLLNKEDMQRNLDSIKHAADQADYVFVYHHNHYWEADNTQTPEWQRQWAHSCIDAGATAFIGHGVPLLHGVEIYKGQPIFYSLGSYIFHTKTDVGHYEPEVWQSAVVNCQFRNGELISIRFLPIALNERGLEGELFYQTRGVPRLAEGEIAAQILTRLSVISKIFGTEFEISKNYAEIRLR